MFEIASRLLGAHISRRAQGRARQGLGRAAGGGFGYQRSLDGGGVGSAQGFGEAPIDHQRLAVFANDDIGRLDVAMQHAARVGIVDRIADVQEPAQLAPLEPAGPGCSSDVRPREIARRPP